MSDDSPTPRCQKCALDRDLFRFGEGEGGFGWKIEG